MKVVGSHGWVYLHHDDVIDILGYSCIHSLKMLLVYVHMFSQYDMKAQDDFGMWYLTWPMVNLRRFYKQILTSGAFMCVISLQSLRKIYPIWRAYRFKWVNSTTK